MKRIILAFVGVLILFSCKTTKQVEKLDATFNEKVQTEQKTESASTENTKTKSKTGEKLTETNNTVIKETETRFSDPDSAGNQYVESVVNREITSGEVREENKNTETEQSFDKTNNQIDTKSDNKQSDLQLQTKAKTKEKKNWPLKQIVFGVIILAVLAFIIFRKKLIPIAKRFLFNNKTNSY
jgi:hypothetical protein